MGPGDAGPVEQDNAIKRSVKVINKKDLERFLLRHYYVTLISAAEATAVTATIAASETVLLECFMRHEIGRGATEIIETVIAETVALVLPAAAPSVVTHNSNNTLSCSPTIRTHRNEGLQSVPARAGTKPSLAHPS